MSIAVQFRGPVARIILSGALDYSTQAEMREANKKVIEADQIREVHVDCAEITFIDSSGIRALFQLQKDAEAQARSVVLINCNNAVREIFEIGGFDKMFTMR